MYIKKDKTPNSNYFLGRTFNSLIQNNGVLQCYWAVAKR